MKFSFMQSDYEQMLQKLEKLSYRQKIFNSASKYKMHDMVTRHRRCWSWLWLCHCLIEYIMVFVSSVRCPVMSGRHNTALMAFEPNDSSFCYNCFNTRPRLHGLIQCFASSVASQDKHIYRHPDQKICIRVKNSLSYAVF